MWRNYPATKEDIVLRDGIQVMELSPKAATVKTGQGRTVPLHKHIIEQGFLDPLEPA